MCNIHVLSTKSVHTISTNLLLCKGTHPQISPSAILITNTCYCGPVWILFLFLRKKSFLFLNLLNINYNNMKICTTIISILYINKQSWLYTCFDTFLFHWKDVSLFFFMIFVQRKTKFTFPAFKHKSIVKILVNKTP